jgi:hypothetical protein
MWWPVLVTVVVVAVAVWFGRTPGDWAAWAGTGFQVAGLWTVYRGIVRLRKDFNHESDVITHLLLLLHKGTTVPLHGSAVATDGRLAGDMVVEDVTKGAPATPVEKLERRIQSLENEVEHHGRKLAGVKADVERLDTALSGERAQRATLEQMVHKLATGGLNLQTLGLIWLFIGVVLGTLPESAIALLWQFLLGLPCTF